MHRKQLHAVFFVLVCLVALEARAQSEWDRGGLGQASFSLGSIARVGDFDKLGNYAGGVASVDFEGRLLYIVNQNFGLGLRAGRASFPSPPALHVLFSDKDSYSMFLDYWGIESRIRLTPARPVVLYTLLFVGVYKYDYDAGYMSEELNDDHFGGSFGLGVEGFIKDSRWSWSAEAGFHYAGKSDLFQTEATFAVFSAGINVRIGPDLSE